MTRFQDRIKGVLVRTVLQSRPRAVALSVPVALAGSLALVLGTTPAEAAEARSASERMPRLAPASSSPAVAARALPAQAAPDAYVVQAGDTVSAIAAARGLRTPDLLAVNGLSWSSVIYPGQVLALAGTAPAPAPTAAAASASHTVVAGDTVSAIARAAGVTTQAVLDANGLDGSSIIYPGQVLALPGSAAPAPAAASAPASAPASGSYTVVAGDTVSAIAAAHGLSAQALLDANGLSWSSIIYPGQALSIPGAGMVPAVATVAPAAVAPGLDAEQSANAQLIIRIGRELGVSERGIAIALGTAMQESWIRNLDWGDRDSLGLFQQRPSTGWGTPEQVRDPQHAIRTFYGGASDPNGSLTRGLLDIPGWESMSYADAAQAVQISAYPERYAQWEQPSYAWLAALG